MYNVVHNTIPNRILLHKIGKALDPFCQICLAPDTVFHRIRDCPNPGIWNETERLLKSLVDTNSDLPPMERLIFLDFKFSDRTKHNTCVWLIANTVYYMLRSPKFGLFKTEMDWKFS